MNYSQYRLAKRNGEIVQQVRQVSTTTKNKWYKPWEYTCEYEYSEWKDLPFIELNDIIHAANIMSDKGYSIGTKEKYDEFVANRNYPIGEK